jgi:hypothetical protein
MKYTLEISIDLPRDKVIALFDNSDNMKFWQKGFISFEPISGEPGTEGAKSKLTYQLGKRKVEMIETITKRHLPEEFHGTYDAGMVLNLQWNYFKSNGNKTIWISKSEFKFSGFMKIMGIFMSVDSFERQSYEYLHDFKAFAEGKPKYGVK